LEKHYFEQQLVTAVVEETDTPNREFLGLLPLFGKLLGI
jgi:hypothetical protein